MSDRVGFGVGRLALVVALVAGLVGSVVLVPREVLAAEFAFSPTSGPPGTLVEVTATDARPGERVTVEGNGEALCSFEIQNNGRGSCTFEAPNEPGNLRLKITGENVGNSDIGTFTVTEGGGGGGGDGDSGNGGNEPGPGSPPAPVPDLSDDPVSGGENPLDSPPTVPGVSPFDPEQATDLLSSAECVAAIAKVAKIPYAILAVLLVPPCSDVLITGALQIQPLAECIQRYGPEICINPLQ